MNMSRKWFLWVKQFRVEPTPPALFWVVTAKVMKQWWAVCSTRRIVVMVCFSRSELNITSGMLPHDEIYWNIIYDEIRWNSVWDMMEGWQQQVLLHTAVVRFENNLRIFAWHDSECLDEFCEARRWVLNALTTANHSSHAGAGRGHEGSAGRGADHPRL